MRDYREILTCPTRALESRGYNFLVKHLNVIDPLKDDNNLGHSVNIANLYRIRCALAYGSEKLIEILGLPEESIEKELKNFFTNTLDRNRRGEREDVQVPVPPYGTGNFSLSDLTGDLERYFGGPQGRQWYQARHLSNFFKPSGASLHSQMQTLHQLACSSQDFYTQTDQTFLVQRQSFYHPYLHLLTRGAYGVEYAIMQPSASSFIPNMVYEQQWTHMSPGIGLYIPNNRVLEVAQSQSMSSHSLDLPFSTDMILNQPYEAWVGGMNIASGQSLLPRPASDSRQQLIYIPTAGKAGYYNMKPTQARSCSSSSQITKIQTSGSLSSSQAGQSTKSFSRRKHKCNQPNMKSTQAKDCFQSEQTTKIEPESGLSSSSLARESTEDCSSCEPEPDQPMLKPEKAANCPPSSQSMEIGTSELTLSPARKASSEGIQHTDSSFQQSKNSDSAVSSTLNSMPMERTQEHPEVSEEEETEIMKSYQMIDVSNISFLPSGAEFNEDFPALVPIVNDKVAQALKPKLSGWAQIFKIPKGHAN